MAKTPKIQSGKKAARAIFEDALASIDEQTQRRDPDPNLLRNGIKAGTWEGYPHDNMPPDCPINVLGMKGETVYVIAANGELHEVSRWDHPTLVKLFSPYTNYLKWAWPAWTKAKIDPETEKVIEPKVDRVARDKAVEAIITEAGRKGLFDPKDNVRGRGGWKAQDKFIWHSGTMLWSVDVETDQENKAKGWKLQASRPADYDGFFYKRDSETLQPWRTPVSRQESPAHELLQSLRTWNWERPYLDPLLLLGWIGSAFLGAALDVRPIVFTTGGPGRGKTTLHNFIKAIFGAALYSTANTTAAGIYQNIGQDSRPVAVDELERKGNSFKEQAIIELARQSYSGAKLYRGGSNHEGVEFELRSSFLFSAIIHPPLEHQDRTRMAILNLDKLDKSHGRQPIIKEEYGRMILRQIMDGYHDFYWHILPKWKKWLSDPRLPFDARAIDTYGTLLACAELLVGEAGMIECGLRADDLVEDGIDIDHLVDTMKAATLEDMSEQKEKWQVVIERIMETTIDHWKGGEKITVGGALTALEGGFNTLDETRSLLASVGLGIRDRHSPRPGYCLAVPFSSSKVDRIFDGTDYHRGGWTVALKQAPENIVLRRIERKHLQVKINRINQMCSIIDLEAYDEISAEIDEAA
ncbi:MULTISPECIES: hypothetical protein [unclassified Rhizobium]|uniref:hypothetical protein n=1 Tax=unclassified Rhizobium TaxID=2613769 RepID=UPI00160CBA33|nr:MULTISPECIES: hypothetical protein [unclassified Rhizobium]MBB3386000.1 hypothetical protein [Rhizobium sp. BK098]MBB3617823.1 hypothetical protein [Rhizobium sp. BK609]MBB3683362.1 hypothetical protein [Rhizobium sp. BK612]